LLLDHPDKPEFDHASSILYFAVPDIQMAYSKLKAEGVRFEDEPHVIAKNAHPRFVDDVLPRL